MLNMRSHSDSKGFELKRPNDSIYSFPCPDCMCRMNKTGSRSSATTWFDWRDFDGWFFYLLFDEHKLLLIPIFVCCNSFIFFPFPCGEGFTSIFRSFKDFMGDWIYLWAIPLLDIGEITFLYMMLVNIWDDILWFRVLTERF